MLKVKTRLKVKRVKRLKQVKGGKGQKQCLRKTDIGATDWAGQPWLGGGAISPFTPPLEIIKVGFRRSVKG